MKVQTTVLFLSFLSGIFLLAVVHAKPSPALMKELIALEKYLEKKQGSDGADGQNQNQDENPISDNDSGSFLNNIEQQGKDRPKNENNNVVDGEDSSFGQKAPDVNKETDVGVPPENPEESVPPKKPEESATPEKPEESVLPPKKPEESATPEKPEESVLPPKKPEESATPEKPEESVPPKKPEESATPEKPEEGVQPGKPKVGGEDGKNPQEGSGPNQSEGQEVTGREHAAAELDRAIRNIEVSLSILETLGKNYVTEFNNDDRKFNELQTKVQETKDKTKEGLGEIETVVQKIKEVTDKKIRENAPARRSHLSDTEFLNIVHSLLTNN